MALFLTSFGRSMTFSGLRTLAFSLGLLGLVFSPFQQPTATASVLDDSMIQFQELDVFYSERLDLINRSGQVLDLRDITLEIQPSGQTIRLPSYTWLPDYGVRIWFQKGPGKKPAPNEVMLLLSTDVFPNDAGLITLKHTQFGDIAETLYGGQGIWDPAPKPEPKAITLIPFDQNSGSKGGPPPLPSLGGVPSASPSKNEDGFEFEVMKVEPSEKNAGSDYQGNFKIWLKDLRGGGIGGALGQVPLRVKALVTYPASIKTPEFIAKPGGSTFDCKPEGEGMVCDQVWWSKAPFQAKVVVMCAKIEMGGNPTDVIKSLAGGGGTSPAYDCSRPKDVRWP